MKCQILNKNYSIALRKLFIALLLGIIAQTVFAQSVSVYCNLAQAQQVFAAGDIKKALEAKGFSAEILDLTALTDNYEGRKVVIALASNTDVSSLLANQGGSAIPALGEQAYALRTTSIPEISYWVLGGDANGSMYGGLQIAENISFYGYSGTYNTQETPFMLNRGMKLNLPLDKRIPTYVGGWSSNSAKQAIPVVWDSIFWMNLIDQQARNRYNMLSVWVHHPFPALVKLEEYPDASLPNIEGFDGYVNNMNHDQRVAFWRRIMQYAHSRGMSFYFFNWNVYVDYASSQYPDISKDQSNAATKDYMYKSLQALIATYPDLDGFGISAGDGMNSDNGFESNETKTNWTWDCFGKAVKDYLELHPDRKFNLIHRSIGTNFDLMNSAFQPLESLPNAKVNYSIKYAMAHMYSTPTPEWTSGEINNVANAGKKTWITIRNDDYFYINWGDHQFVRDFINGIPNKAAINGMYIGSDGYNPSRTYFYKNSALNGQLEVERRWYMEMLWGRLSYNPQISNDVFKNMLDKRFPSVNSDNLFEAWTLASRSLPKVTELVMRNWQLDFHWWPEACWSDPGRCTGFRTIDGFDSFASTDVAKGSNLCNIANSAAGNCYGKKSTYTLADEMEADGMEALDLSYKMISGGDVDLEMAINNIKQMAWLSCYYAYKIRGATLKLAGQTAEARDEMAKAYCSWMKYKTLMENDYYADDFRNVSIKPNWNFGDAAVLKEYTALGGLGVPQCAAQFPWIAITSPVDGDCFNQPADVKIVLEADAGDNIIDSIEFRENGKLVYNDTHSPYTYTFKGMLSGNYKIEARVYNNIGYTDYSSVNIDVLDSTSINSVSWIEDFSYDDGSTSGKGMRTWTSTRPGGVFEVQDGSFVVNDKADEGILTTSEIDISRGPVNVSLQVQGSNGLDATGTYDYVKFYRIVDGGPQVLIDSVIGMIDGTAILSEENIIGNKLQLVIRGFVTFGTEYYYIDSLSVTFSGTPNQLPVLSILSPSNGAILEVAANVIIDVEATDDDGSIPKVELIRNGILADSINTPGSMFSFSLPELAAGRYTFEVKAYDNEGATKSAYVTIFCKYDQYISFPDIPPKKYGDVEFDPGALSSSGLQPSYASSNRDVAVIRNGKVQIVGVGETDISAYQDGDDQYKPASKMTQKLNVIKADQVITFPAITTWTALDADFLLEATASSGLPIAYSLSNPSVAAIENDLVHILGAGETDITASQSGDGNYNPADDITQTLTVNKANQTISFPQIPDKIVNEADFDPGATSSSGLAVSYSSSDTAVATILIDKVHLVGVGTTSITASQAGDEIYNPAESLSQLLTVSFAASVGNSEYDVKIYPNPASNEVYIIGCENYSISLININGTVLMKSSNLFGLSRLELNKFNGGIYFLKISGMDYVTFKKLTIHRS